MAVVAHLFHCYAEFGHLTLQRAVMKCAKIYNALAQLLLCSFNP